MLIINIKSLVGVEPTKGVNRPYVAGADMDVLHSIDNAFVVISPIGSGGNSGRILDYGSMDELGGARGAQNYIAEYVAEHGKDSVVDASGRIVMPSYCDSHTHIVYSGSREGEFIDKIKGMSYEQIAQRGGGILNSADRLREASEDELYAEAEMRVRQMIAAGTGAIEIKSGYGLSAESEMKMLRVVRRLREQMPVAVRANLLAAHAVGREFAGRQGEYVDMIIRDIIPAVAREGLADFIDVFCDKGFFTVQETARMLAAGAAVGIRGKIHANELAESGGIEVGVEYGALSVDHLEFTGDAQIECLLGSFSSPGNSLPISVGSAGSVEGVVYRGTMPTLLPGAAFFLEMEYPPVRKMIDAGLPVALASDYNPGSSPSPSMKFVISLACIKMKMTPAEAINAATLNSAYAMGVSDQYGSVGVGKVGNLQILKPVSSLEFLPYAYTTELVDQVVLGGRLIAL